MERRCIVFLFIFFGVVPSSIPTSSFENLQAANPEVKINPLIKSTEVVCNEEYIIARVYFHKPFSGSLYGDGQPDPKCRSWGDGTQYNISLKLRVGECGVISHMTGGKTQLEAAYYLQFHHKMQQADDQTFSFFCAPHIFQITTVSGVGVRRLFGHPILLIAEDLSMEDNMDYQDEMEEYSNLENYPNPEWSNTGSNPNSEHKPIAEFNSPIPERMHNAARTPATERKVRKPKAERKLSVERKSNLGSKPNSENKPHEKSKPHEEKKHREENKAREERKPNAENKPNVECKSYAENKPNVECGKQENKPNVENKPQAEIKLQVGNKLIVKNKPKDGSETNTEHVLQAKHKPTHEKKTEHKPNVPITESKVLEGGEKVAEQKKEDNLNKDVKPKRDVRPNAERKATIEDIQNEPQPRWLYLLSKMQVRPKVEFTPDVEVKSKLHFDPEKGFKIKVGEREEYIQLTEEEIRQYTRLFRPDFKMFIYSGFVEPPFSNTTSTFVGENMTMVIRVKEYPGFDSQLKNCTAFDYYNYVYQMLFDTNGCAVNELIMPNLKTKYDSEREYKIFYTHFRAFKFPYQDRVQVKCSLSFCNGSCPEPQCENTKQRSDSNVTFATYDLPLEEMSEAFQIFSEDSESNTFFSEDSESNTGEPPFEEVYNESPNEEEMLADVPIKMYRGIYRAGRPIIKASEDASPAEEEEVEFDYCISYIKFMVSVIFLVIFLLVSLVVTICTCVSARELKKRMVVPKTFAPYGRVKNFS